MNWNFVGLLLFGVIFVAGLIWLSLNWEDSDDDIWFP
jgi:hypothetical protein